MSDDKQISYAPRRVSMTDNQEASPPIWLISFTDVIALMLTFFVLLYAMSTPEPEKWEKKIGITAQAKAQFSGAKNQAGSSEGVNFNRADYEDGENMDYLQALIIESVRNQNIQKNVTVTRDENDITLYFNRDIIVDKKYNKNFLSFLNSFVPVLKGSDNRIALVGYQTNKAHYDDAQLLGKILKTYGYEKDLIFQFRARPDNDAGDLALTIQQYTGRRITR